MPGLTKVSPKSWLAFDLNVLRRLTFNSVVLPFTGGPALGAYLKRWNARVIANDSLSSVCNNCVAEIANNGQRLTDDEVAIVLEDAYVPGYRLANPALATWFPETDAWWFDNVRRNIDRLPTQMAQAIASSIAMAVGDYALSCREETRELRQPLSNVFRRLWSMQPLPFDNGQVNTSTNRNPDELLAETPADLMFLRLPPAHAHTTRAHLGRIAWREEWLRGNGDFWAEVDASSAGRLGAATETKSQYLHLLDETLRRASHIRAWAIAHVETGFINTSDIVEAIARIRRVETVYTKDFSELTGTKAVIITA